MTAYPIELKEVVFTKASVIAIPGHQLSTDGPAITPENSIAVTPDPEQKHHFIVTMRTVINKEQSQSCPYSIEMECIGAFRTNGSLSLEEELRGVAINGHSVCYGAIREAVSWMTSRQPYGQFSLGLSVLTPNKPATDQPAP